MAVEVDNLHVHQRCKFVPGMPQKFEEEYDDQGDEFCEQEQGAGVSYDDGCGGDAMVVEEDVAHSQLLSLQYQNHQYYLDGVPPGKVREALEILGVDKSHIPGAPVPVEGLAKCNSNNFPKRLAAAERAECLRRYYEKRLRRNYGKKIRYEVRHKVATGMNRVGGKFAPSKPVEEVKSEPNDDSKAGTQDFKCLNCGKESTPMKRRGPQGPGTLCNACGLRWANKGVLPKLAKLEPSS